MNRLRRIARRGLPGRVYVALGIAVMLAGIVGGSPWAVAHGFLLFLAAMICIALIWLGWL